MLDNSNIRLVLIPNILPNKTIFLTFMIKEEKILKNIIDWD